MVMNTNKLFFLCCFAWLCTVRATAQEGLTVPSQMRFADVELTIEPRTRERIQQRVNQIAGNWTLYRDLSERMQIFSPLIVQTLRQEGCPDDLQYMALQRSGLLADFTTPRQPGATGFWLMSLDLAKAQGLQIDNAVDERKNLIPATRAFARAMQQNNYSLRNWLYACIAYNIGLAEALKNNEIIDRSRIGINQLHLDERTPDYIIDLLAYTSVFRNRQNVSPSPVQLLVYTETKGKTLDAIARATDLPLEQLRYYNSWLLANTVPSERDFPVYLPVPPERVAAVSAALKLDTPERGFAATAARFPDAAATSDNPYPIITNRTDRQIGNKTFTFATVNGIPGMVAADGQSVEELANAAGISKNRFIKINDLNNPAAFLQAGQVLYLRPKASKAPVREHVAQPGESFWSVSQTYGITLSSLLKLNRVAKNETLQPGRVLLLQERRAKNAPPEYRELPPANPPSVQVPVQLQIDNTPDADPNANALATGVHIVQPNESIYDIAQKYGVSIHDLRRWNGIPGYSISAGMELKIRGESTSPVVADTASTANVSDTATADSLTAPPANDIDVLPAVPQNLPTHTVKAGDNIYSIANQYRIPISDLRRWNNLQTTNVIKVGDVLKLYDPASVSVVAGGAQQLIVVNNAASPTVHKVQSGETLFGISKKYNVRVEDLRAWNNLRSDVIAVNQELIVGNPQGVSGAPAAANTGVTNVNILPQGSTAATATTTAGITHQVRFGESVEDVIRLYNLNPDDFYRWNNLPPGTTALTAGTQVFVADPSLAVAEGINITPRPITNATTPGNAGTSAAVVQPNAAVLPPTVSATNISANNPAASRSITETYRVEAGETLWGISQKFNIPFKNLLAWNNMDVNTRVQAGQIIRLQPPAVGTVANNQDGMMLSNLSEPTPAATRGGTGVQAATSSPALREEARIYTTVPGDNIYDLANRFGVRLSEFRRWNNIPPGVFSLPAGTPVALNEAAAEQAAAMKMQASARTSVPQKASKGFVAEAARPNAKPQSGKGSVVYHVVNKGETLFGIARKYNVKVSQIKTWNNLKSDRINAGARIIVKQ